MLTIGSILAVIGLWMAVSPFIGVGGHLWSELAVGFTAAVCGIAMRQTGYKPRVGYVAAIFGAWSMIAAFVPALTTGIGLYFNNIIAGLVIAGAGFKARAGVERREVDIRRAA